MSLVGVCLLAQFAAAVPARCPFPSLTDGQRTRYVRSWWDWVQHADTSPPGSPPERRIKQINLNFRGPGERLHGYMETADPTRPIEVQTPDGKRHLYVLGSGRYAFDVKNGELDNLLRGGLAGRSRVPIQLFFEDGRQMRGPYHTGSLPWDLLLVKWPVGMLEARDPRRIESERRGDEFIYVGYGGTLVQPYRLEGASPNDRKWPVQTREHNDNPSRSRHAFDVEFRDGKMIWRDRGSVFGNRPSVDHEWLSANHEHGYGGRPILNKDGTLYRDRYGKAWMLYERVTVEEVHYENGQKYVLEKGADGKLIISGPDGSLVDKLPEGKITRRLPKVTEMFARRMKNPYETYGRDEKLPDGAPAGQEVSILSVHPHGDRSAVPYPATDRGGESGNLLEGFNHTEATIDGQAFHLIAGSPGNFVDGNDQPNRGYGAILAYRRKADGPIGPYQPIEVKGPHGIDLKNFTSEIGRKYGIIWGPGRPDLFQDARGNWWMIAHGVPSHTLKEGLPHGGWPRTEEEFRQYYRAIFLMPVKLSLRDGKPWLEVEDKPVPADRLTTGH